MAANIDVNFATLPAWTNPCYYKYYFDRHRYNVFYGGAGSGKSHFCAQRVVYRMVAEPGHNYLILRKVARTSRHSTFALVKQIIILWGLSKIFKINESDFTITCWPNGNQAIFEGLDDIEKLKSITFTHGVLTDIWVEEATETSEKDILQLDLRLRGQAPVPFQITISFNPVSALHWIKASFFDVMRPDSMVLKTTYLDNTFIDKGYKAVLEGLKEIDRTYYDIYALGEWGVYGDLVFSNYEVHDFDPAGPWEDLYVGLDFGYNHRYALERIGVRDDQLYFISEIYVRQKTTQEVIAMNRADPVITPEDRGIADSANPADIREWVDAGYEVKGARKGRDSRRAGYSYLKTRKLHIRPECTGMIAELQFLKYKEDKGGNVTDEVIEYRDDAVAAARYATEPLWTEGGEAFAIVSGIGV